MKIYKWVLGPLETNCYLIVSGNEALLIDVGWHEDLDDLVNFLRNKSPRSIGVVATHGHFDHVAGVSVIKRLFHTLFMINRKDLVLLENSSRIAREFFEFEIPDPPKPDLFIQEKDVIRVGDIYIEVLEVPGHTPGSIALFIREDYSDIKKPILFTGDLLFRDSIGRVDFPESSPSEMRESLEKILRLPEETIILPGHGPETTLAREIRENIVLREFLGDY